MRDTGEALRRETATLVTALRKPQVRGSWGETTLKNVARLSGMVERCDFDLQLTSRSDGQTQRPDMRVNLAEGKHVFVDSKVPLSAFLDAAETDDEQQKAAPPRRTFARHVRTHVDQLSSKQYWKAAESPEFVVLFLPSEAFFAAALEQMPDLYEYAVKKDVVIATPTTLIGMLRAISYGWKQAALAEKAAEVFRLGRELHERLGRMGNRFDKLGRAARRRRSTPTTRPSARSRAGCWSRPGGSATSRSARRSSRPSSAVDATVRQIQAPELGSPSGPRRRGAGGGGRRARLVERRGRVGQERLGSLTWPSTAPTPTPGSWAASPSRSHRCSPTSSTCLPRAPVLDVGCGPGVLTEVLVERYGAEHGHRASTRRPASSTARASRLPGVDVRQGAAEALPCRRRLVRRGARPARRALHDGPGRGVWPRWRG